MGDAPIPTSYLQALFDFASRVGGPEAAAPAAPVSAADREWLSGMLRELVAETDPVGHMKRHLAALSAIDLYEPKGEDAAKAEDELEGLVQLVENIDDAGNFHKIGGFKLFAPLLRSTDETLRRLCTQLIGTMAQNHPYIQQELWKAGILDVLLEILEHDPSEAVQIKALFALSSLLGSVEFGEVAEMGAAFVGKGGLRRVTAATRSGNARLVAKATFFLHSLFRQGEPFRAAIVEEPGLIEAVGDVLRRAGDGEPSANLSLEFLYSILMEESSSKRLAHVLSELRPTLEKTLAGLTSPDDSLSRRNPSATSVNFEEDIEMCEKLLSCRAAEPDHQSLS